MADQWQENTILSGLVRHDNDDDAPDDWEAQLDEKPKISDVEEKSKLPVTNKNKSKNIKNTDNEQSSKIVKQPDGDYTPEELDAIKKKEELKEEHDKLNMASELVTKTGEPCSLDNLDLVKKDEFLDYSNLLSNHLEIVSKSEFYPDFIDHFLNGITQSMSIDGVKRLTATLQAISIRRKSEENEKKAKSKPKKQGKPQLKTVRQSDFGAFGDDDQDIDYDDDDDFM